MSKSLLFQKLSGSQWLWLWTAYWRLWPVLLRIKFKQFFSDPNWLKKKVTLVTGKPVNRALEDAQLANQVHESVRLAARLHFLNAQCLPKSIVLADMLCAQGMSANVVIGVSKKGGEFASHAWVELDGEMIAEPESVHQEFTNLNY